MKKLLAILLAAVLAIGVFAACDGSITVTNNGSKAENEAKSDEGADLPTIKQVHLCMSVPRDLALVEEEISKITREKIGCNVELIPVEMGTMVDKMNLLLSGGEDSVDVYPIVMWSTLTNVVKNGQALCLDDYIEKDGAAIKDTLLYQYLDGGKVNGKQYAVPLYLGFATSPVFDMAKSVADQIGVADGDEMDLDGLTEVFRKIREIDPETPIIATTNSYNYQTSKVSFEAVTLDGAGYASILDYGASTEVVNYYESPVFEKLMETFDVWAHELNAYMPDALSNAEAKADLYTAEKAIGMFNQNLNGPIDAAVYTNQGRETIGITLPSGALENPQNMFAVSSTTKYPELSMAYIALMASNADVENLLINGILGTNYILDENNCVAFPEGVDRSNNGWQGLSWANMNFTLVYPTEVGYWDNFVEANANAKPSESFGFIFDPEKVIDEISACNNVCAKYLSPIYVGACDDYPGTVAQFQDELRTAGVDKIVEETTAQFNEWLALK